MAWNASGADRVKSYKVYQELEQELLAAREEIAVLRAAIGVKDELIQRLAAEVAVKPIPSVAAPKLEGPGRKESGVRPLTRPGGYSVLDGTSEEDMDGPSRAVEVFSGPLGHIPSPRRKKPS